MGPRIELITRLDRFVEIRPQWDALWQRCHARVFQTHVWIETWFQACGRQATPRIAVAWHDDAILAAVPLAIQRRFGFRTLEWAAQAPSDYCDALATPETASRLPLLWQTICDAGRCTFVKLAQVRPDAVMRPLLDREPADGTLTESRNDTVRCLGIDRKWPDSEAWFRSLGKKGRNNFWRGERILAELGGAVTFHCLDPAERAIGGDLRHAMALKREWLRAKDPGSPLLGRDGDILEAMLGAAAGTGLLRLFVLSCGDRMAAASVNFVGTDTMDAFLTCYDAAFGRASPGTLLMVHYTRWAFDNGMRKVDFLRGDEPFKSHFANCEVGLATYTGARTMLGKSLLAAHRWRSRVRDGTRPVRPAVTEPLGSPTADVSGLAGGY
jgi:CelD/BcsL family acetyltransferase involved in cellulose biosynthesis